MKILFLHPDLGIGGAERLVVDAGLGLKNCGHEVHFVTNHHEPSHCFKETIDGSLNVTVVGNWIPRSVFGLGHALFAYLRMIFAAMYIIFLTSADDDLTDSDIIFVDQVSAPIPILKLFSFLVVKKPKIIFYCHFPDMLLTKRESILKKLYRLPLDMFEEFSTGLSDCVLVNSRFTESIFRSTFKNLSRVGIQVLYPSCNISAFDKPLIGTIPNLKLTNVDSIFLSINRFEKKKNLELAIHAIACLTTKLTQGQSSQSIKNVHLIMAGGYDSRQIENVTYLQELEKLTLHLKITDKVTFLKSPSDDEKSLLIHSSTAIIYTPTNEHFGIVPIEAMYMKRPVIACNSGGPLETVIDGETGFLIQPDAESFASAMSKFVNDRSLSREMGINGHEHVKKHFSFSSFTSKLNHIVQEVASKF